MEKIIATPHIVAKENAFSKNVIIAGDPLRCQHIANTFLRDAAQINSVRGMTAYTGKYRGMKVSVMPHGMGMPSMAIYVTELFTRFGVENIIRVGTCGAINKALELKDMLVAKEALTNSNILSNLNATNTNCSKSMWQTAIKHKELTQGTLFTILRTQQKLCSPIEISMRRCGNGNCRIICHCKQTKEERTFYLHSDRFC